MEVSQKELKEIRAVLRYVGRRMPPGIPYAGRAFSTFRDLLCAMENGEQIDVVLENGDKIQMRKVANHVDNM